MYPLNLSRNLIFYESQRVEAKDLTFDDAELLPILVGCICHQNIYDLVQIWNSDKAMHRHESTTLFFCKKKMGSERETSNENAESGTGNIGFVVWGGI